MIAPGCGFSEAHGDRSRESGKMEDSFGAKLA
jgi:hypothetical protein